MGQSSAKATGARRPRRSRGDGAIIETADGRLRGRVTVPGPDGIAVTRWVSGRSREAVARKIADIQRDADRGVLASGETTGAYLARWVVAVRPRLRPGTHREYARHVADYWQPLARTALARLTPTDVERVMADLLRRPLSPQTVAHARSTLRRALRDAQRDGLVTRNAAALARPPRATRREMRALDPASVTKLIEATADDPLGPLYAVAVGTGLRLGELLGLAWPDVDMDARQVTVRRSYARADGGGYAVAETKTPRSRRTVALPAVALAGFRRQKVRQAAARLAAGQDWQDVDAAVFTDSIGRRVAPHTVSAAFHDVSERLGLGVRLHDLRHTAATLMLGAGVPLKVVSETLGHSSIAITADVYAHVTPDLRREAAEAMDRALGGVS